MSVNLHINDRSALVEAGTSIFEYAEDGFGIFVPNSCRKRGKCRECLVEVMEGAQLLSEKTAAEFHLKGRYRLSCQTRITANSGTVRCHTMRRGEMKIERHAMNLPTSTVITGIDSMEILKQDLEVVKTFRPLTKEQVADLLARTAEAASRGKFEGFKTTNAFDGTAKNPSWLGEPDKGPA